MAIGDFSDSVGGSRGGALLLLVLVVVAVVVVMVAVLNYRDIFLIFLIRKPK